MAIYIVGLGPGNYKELSLRALELLCSQLPVFLRTEIHPVVENLREQGVAFQSFDYLYEQSANFEQVYQKIAEAVLGVAKNGDVVYAVPGHPLVAEQSVTNILSRADQIGIHIEIISAVSFLDVLFSVLKIDPIHGLKILDGLQLDEQGIDPRMPTIVTQVYNQMVAADVKLSLMNYYADDHQIAVVRAAGVPNEEVVSWVPLYELDRLPWIDHLTSVYVPKSEKQSNTYDLASLVEVMETLRSPGGCPWDFEQTHASLKRYMIEEVYEVMEAIDQLDPNKICDELGDLLLQIVFHARIAEENGDFTVQDVINRVTEKMVRRHPHVFGDATAATPDAVMHNWEKIKRQEKAGQDRKSLLDGVPIGLPSLIRAYKLQGKAAKIGFDWANIEDVWQKVAEETQEFKEVCTLNNRDAMEQEMGDLLFAIVNVARFAGVEPETALHRTNKKFINRFQMMEGIISKQGGQLEKLTLQELDALWNEAKRQESA